MSFIDYQGGSPGHIQYGDFLMGPGTAYRWDGLEGWEDTPAVDSGTVLRSSDHGAWPGDLLAQSRTITVNLIIKSEPGQMNHAIRALAAATSPVTDVELPLVVQLDSIPYVVFARCVRRAPSVTRTNRVGLARGPIQWVATDPRKYWLTESSVATGLPTPEDGLAWPLSFPLDWGALGASGNVTATNIGDAPAHPVITFQGPCQTPSITNVTTGAILEYGLYLEDTDTLTVDTAAGQVYLNSPTASRLYTVTPRSVPERLFVFPPGESALAFRTTDTEATDPNALMTVTWRSAYW